MSWPQTHARRCSSTGSRQGPTGAHRGHGRTRRGRGVGGVLPHPPAREPARRLGLAAEPPAGGSRRARAAASPRPRPASAARRCRCHRTGAASGSSRRRTSSGSTATTGCTTASATSGTATAGAASGWRRSLAARARYREAVRAVTRRREAGARGSPRRLVRMDDAEDRAEAEEAVRARRGRRASRTRRRPRRSSARVVEDVAGRAEEALVLACRRRPRRSRGSSPAPARVARRVPAHRLEAVLDEVGVGLPAPAGRLGPVRVHRGQDVRGDEQVAVRACPRGRRSSSG